MTGESAAPSPRERFHFTPGDFAAIAAILIALAVLLCGIRYCPSYFVGKITLGQMWVDTFWGDIVTQVSGLFSGASKETQSGEASASEWNYCLMVPFIVAWLIWRKLPEMRRLPLTGSVHGYALLGFGFFLYLAGFLMESYYVGFGAMEFIYAGFVLLFLGWGALRLIWFPLLFLMFMWPYNFMEDVALELRLRMSALSHYVLQFIDVPNMLQGTAIMSLPGAPIPFAIDIADPCSGIRSLFALVMIAAVYSFIAFEKVWQQLLIIALAVPLVFLGNLVRIIILALGCLHFGETFALGTNSQPSWFHEFAGYLVYFINFGGLIGAGTLLYKFTTPKPLPAGAQPAPAEDPSDA
ncbi:MAG TPA: exosortase/archaeosortase family protein [Devosia sp.]